MEKSAEVYPLENLVGKKSQREDQGKIYPPLILEIFRISPLA
jgi:hypothetical protein